MATRDVINELAGLATDSPTAALRREKPELVAFAQGSYDALLEPDSPGDLSLLERHAVAYRVGLLTGFESVAARHRARLAELGMDEATISAIESYTSGGGLDPRLGAILRQTDLVTTKPDAAEASDIAALHAAGLTPAAVVTLGQLIGFLAYQVRAIAVARAFAESAS